LGFFKDEYDIWIECKDRDTNVKRADINKLVSNAQDVWKGYKNHIDRGYNALIMATTKNFDIDALNIANSKDVLCLRFQGNRAIEVNALKNWIENPAWLVEIE
jgi:hypothetical protein